MAGSIDHIVIYLEIITIYSDGLNKNYTSVKIKRVQIQSSLENRSDMFRNDIYDRSDSRSDMVHIDIYKAMDVKYN